MASFSIPDDDFSPPPPQYEASPSKSRKPTLSNSTLPSSVKIAVMGATGSGKTTFINRASGSDLVIGEGLESCTAEVQVTDEFTLDGRAVTLIDTPGFDDSFKSDTEILKMISVFLASTYEKGSTLAGVIYIHRISDYRFSGISGRNFTMFRKLCGDDSLKNVVLVTNMWEKDSLAVGEAREKELRNKFLKPAIEKGAKFIRHHNTTESAYNILREIVGNHPRALQIQRELVDERKDFIDTAAGDSLNHELKEQIKRHQAEIADLRVEMAQALKAKDEQTRRELAQTKKELEEKVKVIKINSEGMLATYAAEKERMEAKLEKMEQEAKEERERAEAEYDDKLAALTSRLKLTPDAPSDDREGWEQEIKRLQDRVTIPIYNASDDEDQIGSTRVYLSTDRVANVRKDLLKEARPRNLLKRHQYVEVVMRGDVEGKFLEDPEAHYDEMMGQVEKLVYWTHADINRTVKDITPKSPDAISKMVASATSLVGRATYYQHLLSAREVRDEVVGSPRTAVAAYTTERTSAYVRYNM